ncbi:hypothetical protein D3C78_1293720 [compost metagenome]
MGVPVLLVGAAGFRQGGDHRVARGQQVQLAVGAVRSAQRFRQVGVLAQRQQAEVAAEQPGRAGGLQFFQMLFQHADLLLRMIVGLAARALQAGVEHAEGLAAANRQLGVQQRRLPGE